MYHENADYNLTISNLPWGGAAFSVKHYRISKTENLDLVETSGKGNTLHVSNPLAPDGLELIVLHKAGGL